MFSIRIASKALEFLSRGSRGSNDLQVRAILNFTSLRVNSINSFGSISAKMLQKLHKIENFDSGCIYEGGSERENNRLNKSNGKNQVRLVI